MCHKREGERREGGRKGGRCVIRGRVKGEGGREGGRCVIRGSERGGRRGGREGGVL